MEDIDLNISNGTCYFAAGAQAADGFIPCGNAALEGYAKSCCYVGDKCLSSQACFNTKFTITYLVGCTDPTYGSPECPGKGPYTGQQLVGLTRCDPDVTEWAGCKDDEGRTKPEPRHENCTCEGQSPLFEAGAKLEDIAFLPLSAGGKMSWFPGHSPIMPSTTAPAPTASSIQGSGTSVDASATPTADESSIPSPPPAETLSTGAIAGISVGSVAFVLFLGCLIFMGCLCYRRNTKREKQHQHQHPQYHGLPMTGNGDPYYSPPPPTDPLTAANNNTVLGHPGLSGFKSELPADVPEKKKEESTNPSSPYGNGGHERFSTVSAMSDPQGGGSHNSPNSSAFSTPQHTGQDGPWRPNEAGGRMAPISELHG